ncbi:hypothetical protein F5887DRAFT_915781 [Amanita rubescens]|nr:hypothetical protein F5887DRAFT_915781 [Amanita rubescens]
MTVRKRMHHTSKNGDKIIDLLSDDKGSRLETHHHASIPDKKTAKKEMAHDILTIFSHWWDVTFTSAKTKKKEVLNGHWCWICIKKEGRNGTIASSLGGTLHIGYTVGNIMMSTKKDVKKITYRSTTMRSHAMFGAKEMKRVVEKVASPREFKREKVLECITQFIVCDDQSFEVAEKTTFQNVLASMRPQVSKKDIPSAHKVSSYLHNKYSDWMSQLKEDIKGSWESVMYGRYLDSRQHEGIIPRHHGALD